MECERREVVLARLHLGIPAHVSADRLEKDVGLGGTASDLYPAGAAATLEEPEHRRRTRSALNLLKSHRANRRRPTQGLLAVLQPQSVPGRQSTTRAGLPRIAGLDQAGGGSGNGTRTPSGRPCTRGPSGSRVRNPKEREVADVLDELHWRGLVAQTTVWCSRMRVESSQFSGV